MSSPTNGTDRLSTRPKSCIASTTLAFRKWIMRLVWLDRQQLNKKITSTVAGRIPFVRRTLAKCFQQLPSNSLTVFFCFSSASYLLSSAVFIAQVANKHAVSRCGNSDWSASRFPASFSSGILPTRPRPAYRDAARHPETRSVTASPPAKRQAGSARVWSSPSANM